MLNNSVQSNNDINVSNNAAQLSQMDLLWRSSDEETSL